MMQKQVRWLIVFLFMAGLTVACQLQPSQNPTAPPAFQVSFVDVGQGDAIIIRAGTHSMLIDAGTNASTTSLINTIKSDGINNFDVVVGTHPHEDHIGGMDAVINRFGVGTFYMSSVSSGTKTYSDVLQAAGSKSLAVSTPLPGSSFNLGTATCTILAPNGHSYDDLNSYSIVLRVSYGTTDFLFTGDAQADSEKEMLAKGYNLKADVLKVGHHGSTSTSPEFLKAVSPQYGVIMVGLGNDYGHPHQVTLDKLKAAGVKVYRTDLNGGITFTSDGAKLAVKTAK
jgi:competence protein ComEC